jgi:hypothetical protein
MNGGTDYSGLIGTAITALPNIIALIRGNHAAVAGAPELTDADVLAALAAAVVTTVTKGEAWKLAHPRNDTGE